MSAFKLTRRVRFAINDEPSSSRSKNGYAGVPPVIGLGRFFEIDIVLIGEPEADSGYLRNIVEVDAQVRELAVPRVAAAVERRESAERLTLELFAALNDAWPGTALDALSFRVSPFQSYKVRRSEPKMICVSQKFEFNASHRLHADTMSDDENRALFGKCNNPLGHGHNYEVQVTLVGEPDSTGLLMHPDALAKIVDAEAIAPFDHKYLNVEVVEFKKLNPSVENIAKVIYQRLIHPLAGEKRALHSVTVWETPKTWCEYAE